MMFKIGDRVKTYVTDPEFDSLIGIIVLIDEGWEGRGTIKVRFATMCSYNHITDKILKHKNVEIRFNPEELKVIDDNAFTYCQ